MSYTAHAYLTNAKRFRSAYIDGMKPINKALEKLLTPAIERYMDAVYKMHCYFCRVDAREPLTPAEYAECVKFVLNGGDPCDYFSNAVSA